jgi:hypothetical protein
MSNQEMEKKQEKIRAKLEKKLKRKQGKRIRKSVFGSDRNKGPDDECHNLHWNLTSRPTSIENSQAWKDLFRDSININGDIVSGGIEGPEAMIGALVRHILLQVQVMREKWVSYHAAAVSNTTDTTTSSSEQDARFERARMLATTYSDLDEGQALSIARDVLLSCNRTESGGDTYYCVQSLLCNNNFAVLTPHGCDVDPIEIVVDVVESAQSRRRSSPRPQRGVTDSPSTTSPANKDPSTMFHHLSGITETSPRRNEQDDEEGLVALRDSTTVESDNSSTEQPHSVPQSHYPDSLLNAAAAKVKRGGRHLGDIDDYYDPAQLMLQSDIPGASAIPSNMLLMKEVSKRKKRLSQPGYIDRSDSDNSIGDSTSGDSKSFTSEKDQDHGFHKAPLEVKNLDFRFSSVESDESNPSYITPTAGTTPVCHVNCDDDLTVAVSELTMDTAPLRSARRKSSISATLRKNLGLTEPSDESPLPATTQKKRRSLFSWSNTNTEHHTHTPDHSSHGSVFGSPPPDKHPSSLWKSSKSNNTEDDASSVTDQRLNHHRHPVEDEDEEETAAQSMCIRIQVIVKSRYRLCNLDPQDEQEDTWANITGQFHQHFFLKSKSNGRPAVSDRFVTVKVDDPSVGY